MKIYETQWLGQSCHVYQAPWCFDKNTWFPSYSIPTKSLTRYFKIPKKVDYIQLVMYDEEGEDRVLLSKIKGIYINSEKIPFKINKRLELYAEVYYMG